MTGFSIALLVGVLVAASGVVRMFWAFQVGSLGKGLLTFALGGLTLLCGVALIADPLLAAGFLTIVLVAYLVADGICEIFVGLRVRPAPGWMWLLFAGVVSLMLGGMIWRQFPLSGPWAIGILLGIKLFFVGLVMVTTGSTVRALAKS